MSTLLFTGASGALAPFLIHALMHGDKDLRFVCLVRRSQAAERVRRRVAALCADCAAQVQAPRFEFVEGDVSSDIPHRGPVDAVWHFASDLRMDPDASEAVFASNVGGTRSVLRYAKRAKARLHHISTAYVCGLRQGRVSEDELSCGQAFRNPYEESKAQAEALVRDWLKDNPGMIFRPSIVVGDTQTGVTLGFNGLYKIFWFLWCLKERGAPGARVVLPCASREAAINVVGAQYVTRLMDELHRRPEALGRTFHLVNPEPPTLRQLVEACMDFLEMRTVELAEPGEPRPEGADDVLRHFDLWLGGQWSIYWPYMARPHPAFDAFNVAACGGSTRHPPLDKEALGRLYQYAIDRNFSPI